MASARIRSSRAPRIRARGQCFTWRDLTQVKAGNAQAEHSPARMAPLPEDTQEDCLARAEYAVRQAKRAHTDQDRRRWLEIAEEWRTLALMTRLKRDARDTP